MIRIQHPPTLREEACLMKHDGDSVREIARVLRVPVSTVGGWVRGIDVGPAMIRYCQRCGGAFLASRRDQKFCCRVRVETRQCLFCSRDFEATRADKHYCCPSHAAAGYRAGIRIRPRPGGVVVALPPVRPVWERVAA